MIKVIAYPLSIIYYLLLISTLLFFHVVQWICLHCFGASAHQKSVDILCFFLVANTYVLGTRYKIKGLDKLPLNTPLILAANHQSFYDITSIGWFFRNTHPTYISKIELGKNIPSISYNLRNGGSVLIDRKDPKQSLTAIKEMALYIEEKKCSVLIFPEGTRSKTGEPKPFVESGLKILCKYAKSAYVVPITINNSWKMTKWGNFPLGIGNKLEFIIHDPVKVEDMTFSDIFDYTQRSVIESIKNDC